MNKLMVLKSEAREQVFKLQKVTHAGFFFETTDEVALEGFEDIQKINLQCSLKLTSGGKVIYPETLYGYDEVEGSISLISYGDDVQVNPFETVLTSDEMATIVQSTLIAAIETTLGDLDNTMAQDFRIEKTTFEDGRPKISLYVDADMYDVMNGFLFASMYAEIVEQLDKNGLYLQPETSSIITIFENL